MTNDEPSALEPGAMAEFVGYRLRLAQIAAYREFEGKLTKHGIAPRYLGLLGIIAQHPGQPQSRLAEAIALKRSSLVPIIDRLETEGLVERRASPDDRRYKSVWLTPKGKRVVKELTAKARAQEERLLEGFSDRERRILQAQLGRIVKNLNRH